MLQTIVLAAGKGSRMQSSLPKPLVPVNGIPMLSRVLAVLVESGLAPAPVIVVGSWTNAIQEFYGSKYTYAIQEVINGTATAVQAALPHLTINVGAPPVLILYADHPFLQPDSIMQIAKAHQETMATLTMYTVTAPDFKEWRQPFASFGRVVRDAAGEVQRIVEVKNATADEVTITEVNPALYCVNAVWLAQAVQQIKPNPLTGEYYLTDLVELAVATNKRITTLSLPPEQALGLNSVADLQNAQQIY